MYFDSISEIFLMDGHGLYVWVSYFAALSAVLINYFSVRRFFNREIRSLFWSSVKGSGNSGADEQ